ncbi:MAG: bifunctional riboflavin kinase/FAD synthetase [Planctomycetes bacterium]|nr:bifunctional riboflavin kinase/FAD synthetase [Planctomycetota bacterium]
MLIRDIQSIPDLLQHGAVAIGNFDGVHLGHARIVDRLRAMAGRLGGRAIVFTFDPSPAALLRPEKAPPPLTTTARKAELLSTLGVDAVIVYPTDLALLQLTPAEFFEEIVGRRLAASALVEGTNFYFGRDRAGTIDVLRNLATQAKLELDVVEPLVVDGEPVSSSRVRRLIAAGDVAAANSLLTQPYRLCGTVTRGAGRGASIGFPTANLCDIPTLLPAQGVYAGQATVEHADGSEKIWPAAINIGPNPTFGEDALKVEAHLIGCDETLYGQSLAVDFLARLRDIQPFANVQQLQAQLARDVAAAKAK